MRMTPVADHLGRHVTHVVILTVIFLLSTASRPAGADVGPGGEWVLTGRPATPTQTGTFGTLMTLQDGTVLLIGSLVQRYQPDSGGWTPAGSLLGNGGVPTLLANGKVLVTGLSPAEVYDPVTSVSTLTGAMIIPRTGHRATLLSSGDVLVSGGLDANGQLVGPAELYHPGGGTWSLTGTMNSPRSGHIAVLLPTGKVLVPGRTSAELYDPATGGWGLTNPNAVGGSVGTLLQGGKVLVVGQPDPGNIESPPASQLYDVAAGTWSPSVDLPVVLRPSQFGATTPSALTVLNNQMVLVLSTTAFGQCVRSLQNTSLFDPTLGAWAAASPPANTLSADGASITTLPDGRALLTSSGSRCFFPSPEAVLFRPDNTTARIAVTPSTIDFGTVAIGASVQQAAAVQNTGEALLGGSVTVGNSPGFSVVSGATFSIVPGGTQSPIVGFSASQFGRVTGTATFMSNGGWQSINLKADVRVMLSGRITGADGIGVPSVPLELHGGASATTMTAADGQYSFFVQPDNAYIVVPASPILAFIPSSRSVSVGSDNVSGLDFSVGTILGPALGAAVLPGSRAVQVGTPATAFATIINSSPAAATGCGISPVTTVPATFTYQTTDSTTNLVTGTPNTPVSILAGATQAYMFALTPTGAFSPTDIQFSFHCTNTNPAPIVSGVNTLLLTASITPVADIVALAATLNNDGIVNIPDPAAASPATGVFAVATANVGAAGTITVSADTGGTSLPLSISICETTPATGACQRPAATSVTTQINQGATPTFGVFVTGTATIPFDPANNRIFVRFKDTGGVTRGATSVAVRTQ